MSIKMWKSEFIKCTDGTTISADLVDDLVVDCTQEYEDELLLQQILQNEKYFPCKESHQLPCLKGHSNCYNISEICTYRLNENFHLLPCRTGGHLENCKEFECNMMFKCPNYYCIPWNYVCDGKWDCPKGTDEDFTYGCQKDRECHNLFKCQEIKCMHSFRIHL